MFTTARLRLRGSTPNDSDNLLALYNDPQVAPWISEGYLVPKHASYLDTIMAFISSCVLSCVVEELDTGAFVGLCSFVGQGEGQAKNRNAVMCIALLPRYWSKGYGAEVMRFLIDYAFHDMGMHRVSLTVFEGNERALALYRRLGFVEEGRHRKIVWMKGAWRDTFYMGILEDDHPRWMMSLPNHTQIAYTPPSLPVLLSLSAYLYLLSTTNALSETLTNAPLLGPLLTGILLGPSLAGLLTPALQESLIALGYIGLILIVFEAGLSTHLPLLRANTGLSVAAALTGILVPIALSLALLRGAYGYTTLQAFAAGAALCSTSLGTTLALLSPPLRRTRVGSVLMAAALLDDIVGLVIAGIIPGLAGAEEGRVGVRWETIVRPVLVSIAFGVGTPVLACVLRSGVLFLIASSYRRRTSTHTTKALLLGLVHDTRTQLLLIVLALFAFVAGTKYAGTSELFGAYLAGALLAYVFSVPRNFVDSSSPPLAERVPSSKSANTPAEPPTPPSPPLGGVLPIKTPSSSSSTHADDGEAENLPLIAFSTHLQPILAPLLAPVFFASIGAALPVGSLFTIHTQPVLGQEGGGETPSHAVVWKGLVYALAMVLAKMVVGVWMLVWPEPKLTGPVGREEQGGVERLGVMVRLRRRRGWKWGWKRDGGGGAGGGADADEVEARAVEEGVAADRKGACAVSPPSPSTGRHTPTHTPDPPNPNSNSDTKAHHPDMNRHSDCSRAEPTRRRAAALLGLAMVARGEIALIVAQLARPLLVGPGAGAGTGTRGGTSEDAEEPYAVVVWAIVVSTVGGAVGVGVLLGSWRRSEGEGEVGVEGAGGAGVGAER